ncbi:P-loop NTPase fold protein [Bombella pollinis]|uniref:KAP family NTPase n=1 Tax=Bombella pollinis TaxID=2967337 RepID=A0ABT3WLL7_9PROT|nr:P-loop NTPase fold protein [Bombella pollinis]MCX5620004.1 KAP family NTPase [Bombella pollinis]
MTKNYEWAGPNANVAEVLNKYCYGSSKPPFALMLDGPWGCGKTWLVKRLFDKKRTDRESDSELNMIYVSLYGMQNAEEITQAIYVAMHPILGGKIGELGKTVFKGLLKSTLKIDLYHLDDNKTDLSVILGMSGETKNKDKIFKKRILVLDDVERAKMPVSDILALVQPLVESHENRVILVANEKEIAIDDNEERKRYERTKEKTVYLTLQVQPDIESTWKDVIESEDKDDFKKFLLKNKETFIKKIKNQYTDNLRILNFFITFGDELFQSITEKYKCEEYNESILSILSILYFRITCHIHRSSNHQDTNIEKENQESTGHYVNPYQPLYNSIDDLIKTGFFNKTNINEYICTFFNEKETPSWKKILFYLHKKTTSEYYEDIVNSFEQDFKNKTPSNDGEVLHVCDIYIMLNRIGVSGFTQKNYIDLLKEYVNKYFKSRTFNENNLAFLEKDYNSPSLNNALAFSERETPSFKEIFAFFQKVGTESMMESINLKIKEAEKLDKITDLIETILSKNKNNIFDTLILLTIKPNVFLRNLTSFSGEKQIDFLRTLADHSALMAENPSNLLASKNGWFNEVIKCLKQEIEDESTHPLRKELLCLQIKLLTPLHT